MSCALKLNLIENASSSEAKNIELEMAIDQYGNSLTGSLYTISCFNIEKEDFQSYSTDVIWKSTEKNIDMILRNSELNIGEHRYKIELFVSGNEHGQELTAVGTIVSLDDDYFIHQIISGQCTFKDNVLKR